MKNKLNKKGMEQWELIGLGILVLAIFVTFMILSGVQSEQCNLFSKLFGKC